MLRRSILLVLLLAPLVACLAPQPAVPGSGANPPAPALRVEVSLDPGSYALICNLPDHYRQGMHVPFRVE